MRKSITANQWNSVSRQVKGKWNDWCRKTKNNQAVYRSDMGKYYSLPNIGRMIEFLEEPNMAYGYYSSKWTVAIVDKNIICSNKELADSLWGAVKEVLEGEAII